MDEQKISVIVCLALGFALGVWWNKFLHRSKMTREGKLPKQDQALHTEAADDASLFGWRLYDRAKEVEREIPRINDDIVKQSFKVADTARWDLQPLFRVLDALSLKILLVDKRKWKKAVKIIHDAGIGTLPIVLLISLATTKDVAIPVYDAGIKVKTEAVKLGSFLLSFCC